MCSEGPVFVPPERIRALREREHLSQPIFALYLNVSKNLVSDWERGVKKPGGPALSLHSVLFFFCHQCVQIKRNNFMQRPAYPFIYFFGNYICIFHFSYLRGNTSWN